MLANAAGAKDGALAGAVLPDVAQLTTVAGGIAGDVASVAQRFQVAFNDSAARELRSSIRSVSQLSSDLARTVRVQSKNLDTIGVDVRAGAADDHRVDELQVRRVEGEREVHRAPAGHRPIAGIPEVVLHIPRTLDV